MLAPSSPSTLELIARFHRLWEVTTASSEPDGCVTTSFQCGDALDVKRVSVLVVVFCPGRRRLNRFRDPV